MKISKVERLILANQFQLLSMEENNYISKETAKNYSTILLEGYELLYDDIFSGMNDTVSSEKGRFVLDVLSMYRNISNSYRDLLEKNPSLSLTEEDIAFRGFDGNGEGEYHFAKFFIKDYDRFGDLVENKYMELNSHSSISISKYEKELERYNKIIDDKKEKDKMNYFDLTEEEIKSILRI